MKTYNHQTLSLGIKQIAYEEKIDFESAFCQAFVLTNTKFGNMLILNGVINSASNDEGIYHKALTKNLSGKTLLLGGGNGGCLRELKGKAQITIVDIDKNLSNFVADYFNYPPEIWEEVTARWQCAGKFLTETEETFDSIINDLTDQIPTLCGINFLLKVRENLKPNGIYKTQMGPRKLPWFEKELALTKKVFRSVSIIEAHIPSYYEPFFFFECRK